MSRTPKKEMVRPTCELVQSTSEQLVPMIKDVGKKLDLKRCSSKCYLNFEKSKVKGCATFTVVFVVISVFETFWRIEFSNCCFSASVRASTCALKLLRSVEANLMRICNATSCNEFTCEGRSIPIKHGIKIDKKVDSDIGR